MPIVEVQGKKFQFPDEASARSFLESLPDISPQSSQNTIQDNIYSQGGSTPEWVKNSPQRVTNTPNQRHESFAGKATKHAVQGVMLPFTLLASNIDMVKEGIQNPSNILPAIIRGTARTTLLGQGNRLSAGIQAPFSNKTYSELLAQEQAREQEVAGKSPETYGAGVRVGTFFSPFNRLQAALPVNGLGSVLNAGVNTLEGQLTLPENATGSQRLQMGAQDFAAGLVLPRFMQKAMESGQPQLRQDAEPIVADSLNKLDKQGVKLNLPLDVQTTSSSLDSVGGLVRSTPFMRNKFRELAKDNVEKIYKKIDEYSFGLGRKTTPVEGGLQKQTLPEFISGKNLAETISNKFSEAQTAVSAEFTPRFNKIFEEAGSSQIPSRDLTNLKDTTDSLVQESRRLGGRRFDKGLRGLISFLDGYFAPDTKIKRVAEVEVAPGYYDGANLKWVPPKRVSQEISDNTPNSTKIEDVFALRQKLNSMIYNSTDKDSVRVASQLKDALDRDIEAGPSIVKGNPQLFENYKQLVSEFKSAKEALNIDLLKKVEEAVTDPSAPFAEQGFTLLFRGAKQKRIEELQKIRNLVGEETFKPFQDRMFQHFTRGKEDIYDIFGGDPKAPSRNPLVKRLQGFDEDTLSFLVGKERATFLLNLKELVPYLKDEALSLSQQKPPSRSAVVTQAVSVGGVLGGALLHNPAVGITAGLISSLFVSGKIAEHIMTNPRIVQKLMMVKPSSLKPGNARILSKQLIRMVQEDEGLLDPAQKKKSLLPVGRE